MISPTSHLENTLHQKKKKNKWPKSTQMFSEILNNTMTINKEENDNLDTKIQKFITMKLFLAALKLKNLKLNSLWCYL